MSKRKKWTYEEVKDYFEEQGCELKTPKEEYKNVIQHLDYICSCGRSSKTTFSKFKDRGQRCKECGKKKLSKTKTLTYNEVYKRFEDAGCKLLSTEYIDSITKLKYICHCGNEAESTLGNFSTHKGCMNCTGTPKYTLEQIKKIFLDENCKLLSDTYENNQQLLKYQCECGNISKTYLGNFIAGHRCKKCGTEKQRQSLYKNGTQICSSQQIYIHNLISGKLNYPIGNCCVDILLDNNIICECDFSGHWLNVKLGMCTQEEFDFKEIKRNYFLYSKGYKIIRIISRNDLIPDDEIVLSMIKYANEYLENRHWISFDIDNKLVKCSQFEQFYDFGELTKVSKNNIM